MSEKNERITIAGAPPKYDEHQLKQHQSERHAEYHSSTESHILVDGALPFDFITKLINLANEGYQLSNKFPINFGQLSHHAFMRKPKELQALDLQAIDAQVKQSYVAWLESERESYKQQLTAQLIQIAQAKERKREEAKQAKLLADIAAEVDATFVPLVIPD